MKYLIQSFVATVVLSSALHAQALPEAEASNPATTAEDSAFADSTADITPEQLKAQILQAYKNDFASAQGEGETGKLGSIASIKVGENQIFLNGADTNKLLMSFGNPSAVYQGGLQSELEGYTICFEFDQSGYVKDDEEIDSEALMKAFKENSKEENKLRKKNGLDTLTTEGWAVKPFYNKDTNNLEYALKLKSEDGSYVVNHSIKILGRKGVMHVTLICSTEQLEALRPVIAKTLETYSFETGNKYSEFKEGDKIAEYGLNGLIAGGVAFGLLKSGLLAKFWKVIVIGVLAIGGFFLKIKNKLFGSRG